MKKITARLPRAALAAARRRYRRWRRNERGSAAVEFAIIAPVFFFLMFVIAEIALIFIAEQVLDNAVFETARLIRTGQAQTPPLGPMTKQNFEDQVCSRASVFIDCTGANFYLDVQSYDEFVDMDVTNPVDDDGEYTAEGFNAGEAGDIIVVRAYYKWPTSAIPFSGRTLATDGLGGKRLIGSFAAFRNEPFTATASN